MNKLQNMLAYLCLHYPSEGDISNARLTKMIYLADWFSALAYDRQLTNIKWVFNHYGPYVDDVFNSLNDNNFTISHTKNYFGSEKTIISYIGKEQDINLDPESRQILQLVIDKTKSLNFDGFIQYIYSTYPVRAKNRYSTFDLPKLAKELKDNQNS